MLAGYLPPSFFFFSVIESLDYSFLVFTTKRSQNKFSPFCLEQLLTRHQQITKQGIRPNMALPACNNPQITGPVLGHEITKLVTVHAEAKIGRLLQ